MRTQDDSRTKGISRLSSWSLAFNGAEPVRAETIKAFSEAFAISGFVKKRSIRATISSTLMVTGGMKFEPPVIRRFDPLSIETGTVTLNDDSSPDARKFVGSGRELMDKMF